MGVVFDFAAGKEFVNPPPKRVVHGAAGHASQIVDILAISAHSAHLLKNALLLQTPKQLHSLH